MFTDQNTSKDNLINRLTGYNLTLSIRMKDVSAVKIGNGFYISYPGIILLLSRDGHFERAFELLQEYIDLKYKGGYHVFHEQYY